MKKKAVLLFTLMLLLTGCQQKVITVADIQTKDGQEPDYIKMQEIELKDAKTSNAESDEDDVRYCTLLIPAGYKPSEKIEGMYVHERSPLDSSNIYYTVSAKDSDGQVSDELTEKVYEETVEDAFEEAGQKVDLQIEAFETIDMDGVPGYKIKSYYEAEDTRIEQLTYLIMSDNTYTITYSQVADDELMADFEISNEEIRLIRDEDVSLARSK
ncbi:MAG: hypothetical protein Q4D94_06845, partial [Bacillota bacterium]|nr:hypothetical protein [Bacillota bacterium]